MQRVNEKNNVRVVFMQYKGSDHTFVICAYKESPFLEECIVSLKKQNIQSHIILMSNCDKACPGTLHTKVPVLCNSFFFRVNVKWDFIFVCQ